MQESLTQNPQTQGQCTSYQTQNPQTQSLLAIMLLGRIKNSGHPMGPTTFAMYLWLVTQGSPRYMGDSAMSRAMSVNRTMVYRASKFLKANGLVRFYRSKRGRDGKCINLYKVLEHDLANGLGADLVESSLYLEDVDYYPIPGMPNEIDEYLTTTNRDPKNYVSLLDRDLSKPGSNARMPHKAGNTIVAPISNIADDISGTVPTSNITDSLHKKLPF